MTVVFDRDKARHERHKRHIARCRYQIHAPQGATRPISAHRTIGTAYIALWWWMFWDSWNGDYTNFQIIDTKEQV